METITHIESFLLVVKYGSFAKAAEQLSINPSTLGRRIKNLENDLGFDLFFRSTRNLQLTKEGESSLESLERVFNDYKMLQLSSKANKNKLAQGLLRVNLPYTFGRTLVIPHLSKFLKKHPLINVQISYEDRFIDPFFDDFDITLRLGELKNMDTLFKTFAPREMKLVASPQYIKKNGQPKLIRDLENHQRLGYLTNRTLRPWILNSKQGEHKFIPNVSFGINDAESLLMMAEQGHGIAYILDFASQEKVKGGTLKEIKIKDQLPQYRELTALYKRERSPNLKVKLFLDFLEQVL